MKIVSEEAKERVSMIPNLVDTEINLTIFESCEIDNLVPNTGCV
jgi:hypothetical protein